MEIPVCYATILDFESSMIIAGYQDVTHVSYVADRPLNGLALVVWSKRQFT